MRRLAAITIAAVLLVMLAGVPALAGAPTGPTTCQYAGNVHRVTISAPSGGSIKRGVNGHINVNNTWCDGQATVFNTDSIVVTSAASPQSVVLYLDNGGFKPGFSNERGSSDEIEITISLGGGNDSLTVYGSDTASDNIVIGKSSGLFVMGRMNLNADEISGIDADLTLVTGIEERTMSGRGGKDVISGAGGAGTGNAADFSLKLAGGSGGDDVTGGTLKDSIIGGDGPDVLTGAGGPDFIDSVDGVQGNDQIFGGGGSDTCLFDSGDSITSCP